MHPLLDSDARGRLVRVAGQKAENVVAATVTTLDNQAKIWGESTSVRGTSSLFVLVGARDVVRQLARSFLDFALIIGLGVVLVVFGHGFHLVDGMQDTYERTPRNTA